MRFQAKTTPVPNLHGQRLRAVLTEETAYVIGLPQLLAEPRVGQVIPCPDSGNVLISREVCEGGLVPGSQTEVAIEAQLLLYNTRRRRTVVLRSFKAEGGILPKIGNLFWWPGGERAIFSLQLIAADRTLRALVPFLIDLVGEKLLPLRLTIPERASVYHLPSPSKPFAVTVVTERDTDNAHLYLIRADGGVQELRSNGETPSGFLPDGESLLLNRTSEDGATSYRVFSVTTGKERPLSLQEGQRLESTVAAQGSYQLGLAAKLPLQLVTRPSRDEPQLSLLYLASRSGGEAVLLAGEGTPAGITQDGKAVLYFQQGQLYHTPLTALPRAAFLAQSEQELRDLTLRRLSALYGRALLNYIGTYQKGWPTADIPLEEVFRGVERDPTWLQNPATGKDDLRWEWDRRSDPYAKTTRVASLGGPRGRAVVFGDGNVVWEPG